VDVDIAAHRIDVAQAVPARLAAGKPEEALADAKALQKARPKEPVGFAFEGEVLAAQKKFGEAASAYGEALKRQKAPVLALRLHGLLTQAGKKKEAEQLELLLADLDAGGSLADRQAELPAELEPLTTKPLIPVENGPSGIDCALEMELAELPPEQRATMEKLRATIRSVAPEATEQISYRMPAFKDRGRILVYYCAFRDHYSMFPASDAVFTMAPPSPMCSMRPSDSVRSAR